MKGRIMSKENIYKPGHFVHFIQARHALESISSWRGVDIDEIGEGFLKIKVADKVINFKCVETTRLREVLDTGRVPRNASGDNFVILAPHNVLIIPCANEGKTFPDAAPVNWSISKLEEGCAQYSPTTDGKWHLFSIAETDKSESTTS